MLNILRFLWISFVGNYPALMGVLVTAGFSYLIFKASVRNSTFFSVLEKYETRYINVSFLFANTRIINDKLVYSDSGIELTPKDQIKVVGFFNLFTQIGILYKKGLINRGLVYIHFYNIVSTIFKGSRNVLDFFNKTVQINELIYLHNDLQKIWNNKKRIYNAKNKLINLFKTTSPSSK